MDSDGERLMSDPLGSVGKQQRRDLNALHRPIWAEDDPEMAVDESTCGPRSLAALAEDCLLPAHTAAPSADVK
jgi:hypothetical protein